MTPPPPARGGGPPFRLLAGALLCIIAVAVAVFGFMTLIRVLESGGYGTPDMRRALTILGASGAALAAGVATVIWDISKRYGEN